MIARDRRDRVLELVRKEFRQIFRDPRLKRMLFAAPLVQLLGFGYAVTTDVRAIRTMVVDLDRTAAARDLLDAFTSSGYFTVRARSDRPGDLVDALDHGRVTVGLVIPRGFARDLAAGREASVQVLLDGTNSNTATVAMGYAERIVQAYALAHGPVRVTPPLDVRARAWFNPGLVSRDYNVPAVIGAVIMLLSLMLTSLAVVRERELGTLEQLMVSPLTPAELIAGKTIPFAVVGLMDLLIVTVVGVLWFHVPFRGNPLLLLLAALLFLLPSLALGLLISTVAATQQEAFLSTFMVFQPTMLLSGFMFPVTSMPAFFQWLTLVNPLRHFLEIVRGIFLKGAGLDALWPQYLALVVIGSVLFAFAGARFQKTAR